MNRTIKFRAWDKVAKEMYYQGDEVDENRTIWWHRWEETSGSAPMQFTGLVDKNGKEIYEGDILEGLTYKEPYVNRTSTVIKREVVFKDGAFEFKWSPLPSGFRTYPFFGECEVVGNIHENPELL